MKMSPWVKTILREPLLHFFLIGGALFLIYGWRGKPGMTSSGPPGTPATQIIVTQEDMDQLLRQFEKTWQRLPSQEEQKGLFEDFVRNEIYYREALALGLERDDAVFKRRMRQKMEFIFEDISALREPTTEELQAFIDQHQEKYRRDPQVSFQQVFFSADKRGVNTEADARLALAQLTAGGNPDLVGDALLLGSIFPLSAAGEIQKQFGEQFCKYLLELKPGMWAGPIRSTYGLHLVQVSERQEARLPGLNEIREAVKQDWTAARQRELKDAAYAKLRERYSVTFEQPKAPTPPRIAAAKTGGKS